MSGPFAGRKVVLTGATRGIGACMAQQLIDGGAHLVLPVRSPKALGPLLDRHAAQITILQTDLSDPAEVLQLAGRIATDHPDCAGLINNAAVMVHTLYTGRDPALDRIAPEVALNLTAPMILSARLLPVLARQSGAFLCNVTSGLALSAKTEAAVYSGTKAGLRNFTRGLRNQVRQAGWDITVTEALLPVVDTTLSSGGPEGKMPPEVAARHILSGIGRQETETFIGKARLLAAILRASPALGHRMMARM
ncbi:SDR family NAD(P)-dependent oxidoreductase [Pseudooceanicola sp. C21-150M6]|uniref:SDR family NAD(P)-dependent oxidoreductase n=1 Tax=Pseudooceanicola sp. C21-150M6 TaxID=3434355 RepID=UPI003D7F9E34